MAVSHITCRVYCAWWFRPALAVMAAFRFHPGERFIDWMCARAVRVETVTEAVG
jgi:hypothetical protein